MPSKTLSHSTLLHRKGHSHNDGSTFNIYIRYLDWTTVTVKSTPQCTIGTLDAVAYRTLTFIFFREKKPRNLHSGSSYNKEDMDVPTQSRGSKIII